MTSLQDLSLEQLRAHAVKTFRQGGGSRPDVLLIEVDGKRAVLKDYSRADPAFRRWVGPLSARREARALARLEGVHGVPKLIGSVGRDALLLEYIEGTSAKQLGPGALPADFFVKFYQLIDGIHHRGVAHCDLRSTGNILVGAAGEPYIVDFVAHFRRGRWWNPVTRWMYAKFCHADRVAVARLKRQFAPEMLSEAERADLARDRKTWLELGARFIGKSIRNVSRLLLTRRRKSEPN